MEQGTSREHRVHSPVNYKMNTDVVLGLSQASTFVAIRARQNLGSLGMDDETRGVIEEASDLPNGLLLVTGPTGCGKSSTLYPLLDRLNQDDVCLLTAEDPIESRIAGVTQL